MGDFGLFFRLGVEHISDIKAYDHMLFIISLCAVYLIKEWKSVLILVTAFTVGHSLTLILTVLDKIKLDQDLIETLIPITILVSCFFNFIPKKNKTPISGFNFHYFLAGTFGLIHGMGFANYLRSLLMKGDQIFLPLFSFNLGIEVGQVAIVFIYFIISSLLLKFLKIKHSYWNYGITTLIILITLRLIFF